MCVCVSLGSFLSGCRDIVDIVDIVDIYSILLCEVRESARAHDEKRRHNIIYNI